MTLAPTFDPSPGRHPADSPEPTEAPAASTARVPLSPTPPTNAGPAPTPDLTAVDEAGLVALGVRAQVAANCHRAQLLAVFAEMRDRAAADHQSRRANALQPHFVLTPLEEVKLEFGTLLGLGDHAVEVALHQHDNLRAICPLAWEQCLSGRLDLERAATIGQHAETIADPDDVAKYGDLMADYLTTHDDPDNPILPLTRTQISRAAAYRKLKFAQKPSDQRFAEAFEQRRVHLDLDTGGNGIGRLTCTTTCPDAMLADHRLTLIARKRCENDDETRTLDQMRADSMIDLVLGRLTVGALTSDLEADVTTDGHDPATTITETPLVGSWARPVINVTVPVTTLAGLDDEPGLLSGDIPLPAALVREIATTPGATWHRLLTDPAGGMVELSTTSYQPTAPIVREVTARDRTCAWPGCCRPSVTCECDHRHEHPHGSTCPRNLDPLCKRHHKAKHSDGVHVRRLADGRYEIRTKRGTILRSHPSQQPAATRQRE